MRGGTAKASITARAASGLSPHARGNQMASAMWLALRGPIPACAGEPKTWATPSTTARAYPRMRGGTLIDVNRKSPELGLSPHARGNPLQHRAQLPPVGPIPACAGEPPRGSCARRPARAYPRMRGGTVLSCCTCNGVVGLSPHARGNPLAFRVTPAQMGPIPACAGEPFAHWSIEDEAGAYPRMRGGTRIAKDMGHAGLGLSPHARGNRADALEPRERVGPIPACAGEPAMSSPGALKVGAYPRMRGGTAPGAGA